MNKRCVKVGNAQGFWGDRPGAAAALLRQQPDIDYINLDYLAELSLSIMAGQREKNPKAGYALDFLDVVRSLIPHWQQGSKVRIVTNAGGLAPHTCAEEVRRLLDAAGLKQMKIGVVSGDDVLPLMHEGKPFFKNSETGESPDNILSRFVAANAYLGAEPIAELLLDNATIVITGRVADPSLTVGPAAAHFGWAFSDHSKIAGATVAGHLIECGAQATGGISTDWLSLKDPAHIGFPVAEIYEDGSCILTKPAGTTGAVNLQTVKEQLLYEIGDPARYLSPDATVSFLTLQLAEEGENRVRINGASGSPPPPTFKVSAAYRDGFKAEAFLGIFGRNCVEKARRCGEIVLEHVKEAGYVLERAHAECLGAGDVVSGLFHPPEDLMECVLRIGVADSRKEAVECFSKEIAPLVTAGPQGVVGYASGRPKVRPLISYWPCSIPRDQVQVKTALL